eukprot:CAMPEP_0115625846 /NCGR_PEP_ID=MMETSP0272-20121206/28033_1 /TAXON_ID=71861 /ORGANISM="Scrippsiella trochoidea, Strain CCMP3099" /LENGTH=544 /DNA_ID=CAMNT_0003062171 /DNA_START=33 /DNA_END=1664 /DNA_ORIENTATION=+
MAMKQRLPGLLLLGHLLPLPPLLSLAAEPASGRSELASLPRICDRGLNLPPTQGTTRDGAFFPGVYSYEYHPEQVARATAEAGFTALRLAVNLETAMNTDALLRHKAYLDAVGGRGVICMFDTSTASGTSWPRTGRTTGKLSEMTQAWRNIHKVFGSYGDSVMYELFNEPWGYKGDARSYVTDMQSIVSAADLPLNRCILAGLYGSADVQSVDRAGWEGYLAYHVYSFWLPEGQRTRQRFSERIQQDLANLSSRVFITEFGVGLDGVEADVDQDEFKQDMLRHTNRKTVTSDWMHEQRRGVDENFFCTQFPYNAWCKRRRLRTRSFTQEPNLGADVAAQVVTDQNTVASNRENETIAFLGGLRDALNTLKRQGHGVRGLYHWHGWHNGDTWDFWDAANARSSRMIQMIMADQGEKDAPADDDSDPFLSSDFIGDEQVVHMVKIHELGPKPTEACPAQCSAKYCQPGNPAEIGGKHLTGNFCAHTCSTPFSGMRYCGAGVSYQSPGAVDCSACANPAMCAGLPCWSDRPAKGNGAARAGNGSVAF